MHIKYLNFILLFFTITVIQAQEIKGNWYSKTIIDKKENHYLFNIRQEKNNYQGVVDFLTEKKFRVSLDTLSFTNNQVKFTHKGKNIQFKGILDTVNNEIKGIFKKGERATPFILSRIPQINRTQIIGKTIPYISKDIFFHNKDSTRFAGTITYPKKGTNLKALVLITGSGAQNRDEEILGHKPFKVLADYLTRKGFVVLRYDDRGYGESEGEFRPATSMDYAYDALGAVKYLKGFKEVSINKIGLIGHSEGGNIAPIVANMDSAVDFLIFLAAPGTSNYEQMLSSLKLMFTKEYPEMEKTHYPFYKTVYKDMSTISNKAILKDSLQSKFEYFANFMGEVEYSDYEGKDDYIINQVNRYSSDWWHFYLSFDVTKYLKKLTIPILALNGDKDTDVESTANLKGIKKTLEESGNKNFEIIELKNVNHFFQVSADNKIENVYFNEETFSKIALDKIYNWLKKL